MLWVNNSNVTYFDSFGVEHFPQEIKAFINSNNNNNNNNKIIIIIIIIIIMIITIRIIIIIIIIIMKTLKQIFSECKH